MRSSGLSFVLCCHLVVDNVLLRQMQEFVGNGIGFSSLCLWRKQIVLVCVTAGHWHQRKKTGDQDPERHLFGTASLQ